MSYAEFDQLLSKLRVPKGGGDGPTSFADGGAVLSDNDFLSDDDFQQSGNQNGQVLSDSDFLSDDDFKPEAESAAKSFGRAAAHGVVPAAGGLAGAAAAAELSLPFAPVFGPAAPAVPVVAGLAGYFGGSYLAGKGQEAALDAGDLNDQPQRQVNAEAHPIASTAGDIAPALATMSPGSLSDALASRVLSGGIMATAEGVQEKLAGEDLSPARIGGAAALGVVFNRNNRLGDAIAAPAAKVAARLKEAGASGWQKIPGRPDQEPTETSAQEKADASQSEPIKANTRGIAIEQPPPSEDVTIGARPDNKPVEDGGSTGKYAKGKPSTAPPVQTKDGIDPAVEHALASDSVLGASEEGAAAPDTGEGETPAPTPAEPPAPASLDAATPATGQPTEPAPVPARVDEPTGIREMFEGKNQPVLGDDAFVEEHPADKQIKAQNEAAQDVHTEPTEGQKEAGNYKKGHVRVNGLDVTIENPQGSERSGVGPDGKPWSVNMPDHYGYIKRTEGADGDHVDTYLGDTGDQHFVVDQFDPETGKFDEHKVMMNYAGENSARNAYNQAFNDGSGKDRLGAITPVTTDELKTWLKDGDTSKPFNKDAQSAKVSQNTAVVQEATQRLEAAGLKDIADAIRAADPADQSQLATRALKQMDRRSDRPLKDEYASARVPSKAPVVEGTNVTARSKADAARKGAALKTYQAAFDKYAPEKFDVPTSKEDVAALKDRLTAAVTDVEAGLNGTGYRVPNNPAFAWYKKAKALINAKTMTQKKITDFIASERGLRGTEEDVANELATNRIEGGIANSRRSGDDAVAAAENEAARQNPFEVSPEDIEADTAPATIKGAEDLPREGDKEIDITKPEDRAQLADALAQPSAPDPWQGVKAEQASAAEAEAAKTARLKALRLATKGETKRDLISSISDEDLKDTRVAEQIAASKDAQKNLLQHFAKNESGSIDPAKFMAAVKQSLRLPWKGNEPVKLEDMYSSSIAAHEAPRAGEPKTHVSRDEVPPAEDYGRDVDNNLYRLRMQHEDHVVGTRKLMDQSGDNHPALVDKPAFEDIYRALERDDVASLPKAWQEAARDEIKPMLDMNESLREELRRRGVEVGEDVDNHIMRIPKDNKFDPFAAFKDDPVGAVRAIATGRVTPLFDRTFKALENVATGQRHVISRNPDGTYQLWNRFKQTRVNEPLKWEQNATFDVPVPNKPGQKNTWKMTDAYTDEIEKNALGPEDANGKRQPMAYYKNPLLSVHLANVKLSDQLRHVEFMDQLMTQLKGNPDRAVPPGTPIEKVPDGYRTVDLPNLKDWKLHPDLANVIDDFTKPGLLQGDAVEKWRGISNALLRTLFITPTAHIFNVGAHWFSGRGWDNFTPYGTARLIKTMPEAIKSVMTQDATQSLIRQSSGGTMYGSVLSRDVLHTLADKAGEAMAKDPERWGPMLAKMGMNKPADYVSAIYTGSSHVMWAVNDMLVTQRFLENRMKGMSVQGALNDTYKDIPNYRIPSKVMGSRLASQFMQDNLLATFNRYHYGMMNAWANVVKDAVGKNASTEERVAAAGKLAAIGFAMFVAKPMLDYAVKNLTGNKGAEMHARGPLTIPEGLISARKTGDFSPIVSSLLPMSPVVQTAGEAIHNKDFAGRPIAKPGDVVNAGHGSPTAAGRIALDEATHLAKGLVSPVNTVLNAAGRAQNEGKSMGAGVAAAGRDMLLDIKNPSNAAQNWQRNAPVKAQRALRQDMKKPRDPLERLYDQMFGMGTSHF